MTTQSGTFQWQPALADLIIAAYGRCQIRRAQLTVDHLADAATAANLLQMEWANEQINLWTVDLQSIPLEPGTSTYPVDPTTVMIMAAYVSTEEMDITVDQMNPDADDDYPSVDSTILYGTKDRIVTSVDRDTYGSFPDKLTPGDPTVYWFNKQIGCSITLWQPPDASKRRVLHFYRARELQDASIAGGAAADVPRRFLEAYTAHLAAKLAELYAPAREQALIAKAVNAFRQAAERDVEQAPMKIVPALSTYTNVVY